MNQVPVARRGLIGKLQQSIPTRCCWGRLPAREQSGRCRFRPCQSHEPVCTNGSPLAALETFKGFFKENPRRPLESMFAPSEPIADLGSATRYRDAQPFPTKRSAEKNLNSSMIARILT